MSSRQTGGVPTTFGKCTECGRTYTVQFTDDGDIRPIGTDGTCACDAESFTTFSES
jgi:hypothetical protein